MVTVRLTQSLGLPGKGTIVPNQPYECDIASAVRMCTRGIAAPDPDLEGYQEILDALKQGEASIATADKAAVAETPEMTKPAVKKKRKAVKTG